MNLPDRLKATLAALFVALGIGGYIALEGSTELTEAEQSYVTSVIEANASDAIKIAMVMGFYFESSNRLITKPYLDKLANPPIWTVCNGITTYVMYIDPAKEYTAEECVFMELKSYERSELLLNFYLDNWEDIDTIQQATLLDFVHNLGIGNFTRSSLSKYVQSNDMIKACNGYKAWVYSAGKKLNGLVIRRDINNQLCQNSYILLNNAS